MSSRILPGLLLAILGCGRVGFAADAASDSSALDGSIDSSFDAEVGPLDSARPDGDADVDAGVTDPDVGVVDGDAGASVGLRCSDISPVTPTAPTNRVFEAAMRTDGLTLVARHLDLGVVAAGRATVSDPFEDWVVLPGFGAIEQDHFFFLDEGEEHAVGSRGAAPRRIEWCRPPVGTGRCDPLALFVGDELIADDTDGPTVATIDGALVMVFNRDRALYFARPSSADRLQWDATQIELGGLGVDDPALTSDGRILVIPAGAELFWMRFDHETGGYVDLRLLSGVGGVGPTIGAETPSTFELFTGGDSRGVEEIHRRTCTIL